MPEDSIMDWVNNEEPLYNDMMAMFDKWMEEGDAWDERRAFREARRLAAHFAEALESGSVKYGIRAIDQAAKEMMEDFEEHQEYVIKKAAERALTPSQPEVLTPEDVEHAKKYDALARQIGIDILKELIPASPEKIRKAIEKGDTYLNSIPLRKWDQASAHIYLPGKNLSLSERVCALKHVARWYFA